MKRTRRKTKRQGDSEMRSSPPELSRRTLRLTFQYEGSRFELVSQMRVQKLTPPSLNPFPDENSSGYWVELRDKNGKCLFHRLLPDAIRDSAEIYPEGKPLARAKLREIKGRFEVLLPDLDNGVTVAIMGHPISDNAILRHKRCGELAKFTIKRGEEGGKS